ncbi:MAG TPA: hypothetical protein PKD53_25180 [Chloroflexaceae bacterium]|nr:hypothetical protein [Chloroflexaceae bacterium]
MAPVSTAQRIQRLLSRPREKLRPLMAHPAWRWAWRAITALSLLALGLGAYSQLDRLPQEGLQVRPGYLLLALAIYLLTFLMHLMGWHRLSRLLIGELRLREDVEAVAASNLVKYLPTIAWYIANRAHYYGQRGVPQARVVKASFYELGFMVGACAALLGLVWLYQLSPWAALAAPAALGLAAWALYAPRAPRLAPGRAWRWLGAFLWYGATWPLAGLFLWAVLNAFVAVPMAEMASVQWIWLAAALAGYAVSLTLGFLAIAREITLTVLLAQLWPLPIALACAIAVRLLLNLGEVVSSLVVLGALRLAARARHE